MEDVETDFSYILREFFDKPSRLQRVQAESDCLQRLWALGPFKIEAGRRRPNWKANYIFDFLVELSPPIHDLSNGAIKSKG